MVGCHLILCRICHLCCGPCNQRPCHACHHHPATSCQEPGGPEGNGRPQADRYPAHDVHNHKNHCQRVGLAEDDLGPISTAATARRRWTTTSASVTRRTWARRTTPARTTTPGGKPDSHLVLDPNPNSVQKEASHLDLLVQASFKHTSHSSEPMNSTRHQPVPEQHVHCVKPSI